MSRMNGRERTRGCDCLTPWRMALALGLAVGLSVGAGGARAADLLTLYRQALLQDPSYAAARASMMAGQEQVVQGRALLLPNVALDANALHNRLDVGEIDKNYGSRQWTVRLTQPLFRLQNWAAAKQGELRTSLSDLQWAEAQQEVALRLARAYFDVVAAQEAVDAAAELHRASSEQLAYAKKSFEVGTVTIVDVHEAQSRFDLADAQLIAAQNQFDVAQQALAAIVVDLPQRYARLSPDATLSGPEPARMEPWVEAAQQDNFLVQQAMVSREIAQREVQRRRAGHLPSVDLVAQHGKSRDLSRFPPLHTETVESSQIGVQVTVPLYAGGATQSQVREGAALLTRADREEEYARRQAVLSAREAFLGLTSGLARVRALEAALQSSLSNLASTRLGYEVGVRINVDVLNAMAQVADARTQLSRARYDTLLWQLRLKAAVGRLSEEDLAAVNALLVEE